MSPRLSTNTSINAEDSILGVSMLSVTLVMGRRYALRLLRKGKAPRLGE
jgi:hypothetical protein